MIWGISAVIICILLLLKYAARKLKWHSFNRVLGRYHEVLGGILCVVIFIHIGTTYKVWAGRNGWLIILGIAGVILISLMGISCYFRKRLKEKWIKYHRAGACLLMAVIIGHVAIYYADFFQYKRQINSIKLMGIDARDISDGIYIGEYDAGYIYAKVEVIVKDGEIKEIYLLKHINERGKKAEAILNTILDKQHTKVDTVTGATNSSLVIEEAVENALEKGEH